MFKFIANVWLGLVLIALASGLLLYSDLGHREAARPTAKLPRLVIMQWASTDLLDHVVEGIVEGLRQRGYEDGKTATIKFLNASGDNATGNLMARSVVGGDYDLVLTASTLAMQAVAAANREGRVSHLFGGVTDPYGAGVGITGPEPTQHPPHLAGVGTFQPVDGAIRVARQMNPALRKIGVVWNPGEDNSAACLKVARATCAELEIELLEANAGTTTEVPEAIRSILSRGVDAIWVGGDTVAIASISALISAAQSARRPVFSNDPSDARRGALFGLGAAYRDVGIAVGDMAGKVLRGARPADFGVANLVPEVLAVNPTVAESLPDWTITPDLQARAQATVQPVQAKPRVPVPGRIYNVGLLYFGPHPIFELAMEGLMETLGEAGFIEGDNLVMHRVHPNGDMGLLPQVAQALGARDLDLVVPFSTPALGAALSQIQGKPLVFGVVSAPLRAGAGKSFTDHLPQVTGAVWDAPKAGTFQWLKELFPACRTVGLIYNASEANSVDEKERAREMLAPLGMVLEERTIAVSSDIVPAIQSLMAQGVDAVFGMADNTVISSYSALSRACQQAGIPLLADDRSQMGTGALFAFGASPRGEGRQTGRLAARVLLGERTADIPITPTAEYEVAVDFAAAAALKVQFPLAMLKKASVYFHPRARFGRPFRIALVNLVQNPLLDSSEAGVLRGLKESGFEENEDFVVKRYCAQGEMAQLPALLDAAVMDKPDLIVTVTTPALMAAAHRIKDIPVVFTVASDPATLNLFTPTNRPANIAGVYDNPLVGRLLDMAREQDPALTSVGIVYDPAQANSMISVTRLRQVCADQGVKLIEATASTVSELPAATQALIQRGAGAILLSADNLVSTGFPAIHNAAKAANIPIYVDTPALAKLGATGAIGDDYEAWGAQSGRIAAKALSGVPVAELPVEPTKVQQVIRPQKQAADKPARPWEIRIIRYNDAQFSQDSHRGVMDGLARQGLQEGRDFNARVLNAQGDLTTLSSIMTAVRAEQPDLLVAISTPALQAALRQAGPLPIVFCSVGDGVQAGAGESVSNHLPNVTGITTRSPFEPMARLIRQTIPGVRSVGTLFSPSEVNSELYRAWFAEALQAEGLELESVPVNNSAEVAEATSALLKKDIQLVSQIADNATRPAYAQIVRRAADAGLPFFCFDSAGMKDGAALAYARDYYYAGVEAAEVAVRILRGERPADIPFTNTRTEILVINPAVLQQFNLVLPSEFMEKAKTP